MKLVKASFKVITKVDGEKILKNIELAGRTAYKSENKITESSSQDFIRMILKRGHLSVIEHESITVKIICDRGVSHEIVRHRIASYTQESTRYCNYSKLKYDHQLNIINIKGGIDLDLNIQKKISLNNISANKIEKILSIWEETIKIIEKNYMKMIELGATPQIARSILPNSLKTEIVITMNLREWHHFFKLRTSEAAHPQMREIAIPLLKEFKKLIPIIFDDIKV